MNIPLLILVAIVLVALIIFLIVKNQKDKVQLEETLNNDYNKSEDKESDIETEEEMK